MTVLSSLFALRSPKPYKSFLKTFSLCLAEARPVVQLVFQLRFWSGAVLVPHGSPHVRLSGAACVGAAVWMMAVVSVYLFNGVMDVPEDRLNGSRRPIARGDLDPAIAMRMTICLAVLATVGGFLLGALFGCMVLCVLALGYLYSGPLFQWKRRTSTTSLTLIAAGVLTYYAGYVSAGHTVVRGLLLPVFGTAMALWMGLVGAGTKDLSDLAGDAAAGRRTGLVVFGETKTRIAVSALALAVGAAFLAVAAATVPPLFLPALVTQIGAVIVALLTISRLSTGDRLRRRRPYRAFMITQYVVHLSLLWSLAI